MKKNAASKSHWLKTSLILGTAFVLMLVLPDKPIDPWEILDLKKVMYVIFALALIQTLAGVVVDRLGSKAGVVLLGFLAGLVSSTATTATIARKSRDSKDEDTNAETVVLLSATLAMLGEAALVLTLSLRPPAPVLYLTFAAPVAVCLGLTLWMARRVRRMPEQLQPQGLELLPLLKLTAFIVGILALSKFLQGSLGDAGLMFLTFGVSLFEIHGSIIANIQLANAKAIEHQTLITLFSLSVVASFVSKMVLIFVLGSRPLKIRIAWITAIMVATQALSWTLVRGLL